MMVRRTMSACGDVFNKAELGSGVRVLEPLPVRYSNPEPKLSHPRDRHSSPHSRAACQCPCWLYNGSRCHGHLPTKQIADSKGYSPGNVEAGMWLGEMLYGAAAKYPNA